MPSGPLQYGGTAGAGAGGSGGTSQAGAALGDFQQLASGLYIPINGTGVIATVNIPADGSLKSLLVIMRLVVTATQTGGAIGFVINDNLGASPTIALDAGAHTSGTYNDMVGTIVDSLPSGSGSGTAVDTVVISQTSAMSAGTVTFGAWAVCAM
jgi:hypothetical protein